MKRFFTWLFGKGKSPGSEHVPFFDFSTGQTHLIPKSELCPGVVLIRIEGQPDAVYVDAAQLKPAEFQHPPFEGQERAAIQSLVTDLDDVYPMSFEEWEEGFRRDRNPRQEIAGWCHVAVVLNALSTKHSFDLTRKKECYRVLMACFTGSRDTVRERSDPKLLTPEQVEMTIRYYYEENVQ